jgi:hypothetical protein
MNWPIPPLREAAKLFAGHERLVLKEFTVEVPVWESIPLSPVTAVPTRTKSRIVGKSKTSLGTDENIEWYHNSRLTTVAT